jgi:geranylgeranyl diphosphate synthase, type II
LTLETALTEARTLVDQALQNTLAQLAGQVPQRLLAAMEYSLLAPGKRLRPALVLWAGAACGLNDRALLLPAAQAVEMIHTYSLIHDDLPAMDNDDLRRGRPTCHRQFDDATAILAGDGLLTLAFQVLAEQIPDGHLAARCCAELSRAAGVLGMVGGQQADLAAEGRFGDVDQEPNLEKLASIHRRKTGAMIRVSLTLGALVAGANPQQIAALESYGERIGLAFQIADDLIDVQGNQELAGKRVGKDQVLGKMTYPTLCGIDESLRLANSLVDEAIQAIEPFGVAANLLEALARYVIERKH